MTHLNRQRLKLLSLIAVFAVPLLAAWVMVEWRLGIPEARTAHGELKPEVPALRDWPLESALSPTEVDGWLLAFDCSLDCDQLADQWWRLHRALGKEATRVRRLRIDDSRQVSADPLPGEARRRWARTPEWQTPGEVWILSPEGLAVLGYRAGVDPYDVLDDLKQLLRMNPEPITRVSG
ncbi:hypothetical protein [Halomonas sp. YLGW01]|uniref:hypothetical protein n=1 Tax=Halomonas sp. YLGW01 TaxID=2773308 RepID=UPI00177BACEA|nr:hypothetical protein [Halomonas sp. YLGW01]